MYVISIQHRKATKQVRPFSLLPSRRWQRCPVIECGAQPSFSFCSTRHIPSLRLCWNKINIDWPAIGPAPKPPSEVQSVASPPCPGSNLTSGPCRRSGPTGLRATWTFARASASARRPAPTAFGCAVPCRPSQETTRTGGGTSMTPPTTTTRRSASRRRTAAPPPSRSLQGESPPSRTDRCWRVRAWTCSFGSFAPRTTGRATPRSTRTRPR
mmetsp:Transcript_764/g.2226  ORF Transcript_764/g.2226 Transcript_764/m.2226 type:complete len:212 (-) Transcript_764:505-1140(-)